MRLLYVSFDRGIPIGGTKGASIHVAELLRALAAEGHATALLVRESMAGESQGPVFTAPTREGLGWVPGRHLRRDLREIRIRRALRAAVQTAIADFRPDVIYERYALFRSETCAEAARARIPHLLEVNAPLAWEERRFRHLTLKAAAERAERQTWRHADLVVVPSHPLAGLVRARGQEHVLVVPNAVDIERFERPARMDLRARLGLESRFVVGFVGSVKPWHDFDTLVAAVERLPGELRTTLLVVGTVAPEGLPPRASVELVTAGAVSHEQVPEYLAAMDACVAGLTADPELHYFSPLKVLEYLAAGRPTVVADAGDLTQIITAGAALGYRPGDAADLAVKLLLVASDADVRGGLARGGRAYARTHTWREAARAIAQAAERLRRTSARA
jgi:glycosyltransferase involved in cell wall biosynthesis